MRRLLAISLLFIGIIACSLNTDEIPTLEVGQDFTNSDVRLLVLDTFTIKLSTFKFDSINTSSSDRLLVGQYSDEHFGLVRSSAYFELTAPPSETVREAYDLPDDATFDSIALILGYDQYFYNDTLGISQITVHELLEDVRPKDEFFFNTSTLEYDSIALAIHNFRAEPLGGDSVHISLPLTFGDTLFDLILENDIDDNEDLENFFKGFSIRPGQGDNASIIGFSKLGERTYLRFFYSVPDEFEDREEVFDLVINPFPQLPNAFNNIQNDASGTPLNGLLDQEMELPSTNAQNLAFTQSGTGYAIKVEFPHLQSIYDIEGTGTVLSAILTLKPFESSYDETRPLRDSINVSILDRNNEIVDVVRTGAGVVFGAISGENEEFRDATYEVPVGVFVERKLNERGTEDVSLVLFTEDYNQTVNGVVVQGSQHQDFKARVEVTYAVYDE